MLCYVSVAEAIDFGTLFNRL